MAVYSITLDVSSRHRVAIKYISTLFICGKERSSREQRADNSSGTDNGIKRADSLSTSITAFQKTKGTDCGRGCPDWDWVQW